MAKRVYFAFHYQDVKDFRANVVRKHNFTEGVESAGYYDHSIWEEAKNTSPLALKRLINAELENTTATVVLIGSDTWARRWVRWKSFKALSEAITCSGFTSIASKGKTKKQNRLVQILSTTSPSKSAKMVSEAGYIYPASDLLWQDVKGLPSCACHSIVE
jgi:MTH538 TIR-like domain (DUF1863)